MYGGNALHEGPHSVRALPAESYPIGKQAVRVYVSDEYPYWAFIVIAHDSSCSHQLMIIRQLTFDNVFYDF
jgi:hypothetical protein